MANHRTRLPSRWQQALAIVGIVVAGAAAIGLAVETAGGRSGAAGRPVALVPSRARLTLPSGPAVAATEPRAPAATERATAATPATPAATTGPTAPAPTTTAPAPTTTIDPARLAQTRDYPSASDPAFAARVQDLWLAIVDDNANLAMPAFFPLGAYIQVKALSDPAADWQNRLVGTYRNDIAVLHRALAPSAPAARFVALDVPSTQAVWVNPGTELNKIGYWRVYDSVIRYEEHGVSRAFTLLSLISWRGQWYVVHLSELS